jgi:hypothetical protein
MAPIPPDDFWFSVNRLAQAYDETGRTDSERADEIIRRFRGLSAMARRQLLTDLYTLASNLPDLYPAIMAIERRETSDNRRGPFEAWRV